MPVIEQEIRRLGNYMGATSAPVDFDAFWSKRMAEADQAPLDFAMTPSEIPPFHTCEYLDLWFRGMGDAQLYAKYVEPRAARPVPLVPQFHGYPGAGRSWLEQSSFAGMGCVLLAMGCPDQGGNGQDLGGLAGTIVTGHIVAGLDESVEEMYYVRLHQNIRILRRIVRELVGIDQSRAFVDGASQGGGLGLTCAALNPGLVNRAAILYPFLSDYRLVWELKVDLITYEGLRYYSRWLDLDGIRQNGWFAELGYTDSKNFAYLVCCPVLFGTGLVDEVCPPATQRVVYNNLICPKRRYLFEGYGYEEIQDFDDLIPDLFGREAAEL